MTQVSLNRLIPTSPRVWLSLIAIFVPALVLGYLWWVIPPHADDLWYAKGFVRNLSNGDTTIQAIIGEMNYRFNTDNIRLANIFFLIEYAWIPWQVMACLLSACFTATIYLLIKLSGLTLRDPLAVSTLTLGYLYMMQWIYFPFSHDFALNYIPSGLLVAATALLFTRLSSLSHRQYTGLCFLALLTGFWHEGAAISLLLALAAYMFAGRLYCKRAWMILILLSLGVLVYLLTPGFFARMGTSYVQSRFDSFVFSEMYLITLPLIPIAIIKYIKEYRKYAGRVDKATSIICLCAGATLGGLMLYLAFPGSPRAGLCGSWLALPGWLILFRRPAKTTHTRSLWKLSAIPVLIIIFHCGSLAVETHQMLKIYTPLEDAYLKQKQEYIFCRIPEADLYPSLWREGRPALLFMHGGYVQMRLSLFHTGEMRHAVFIPEQLRKADSIPGTKMKGENPFYLKEGKIYSISSPDNKLNGAHTSWTSPEGEIDFLIIPYNTDNGNTLYYMLPDYPRQVSALYP